MPYADDIAEAPTVEPPAPSLADLARRVEALEKAKPLPGLGRSRRGEEHPRARLTEEVVRRAREMHATGNYTLRELHRQMASHVSFAGFYSAVRGKSWGHI
jgi:hypothetical protein